MLFKKHKTNQSEFKMAAKRGHVDVAKRLLGVIPSPPNGVCVCVCVCVSDACVCARCVCTCVCVRACVRTCACFKLGKKIISETFLKYFIWGANKSLVQEEGERSVFLMR